MASSNPMKFQTSKEALQPQTSRQPRPSVTPTATSSNNESQSPNSKPSPIKRDPLSHRHQPPEPSDTATTSSGGEIEIGKPPQPQSIKDNLFKKVMEENWDDVISIYRGHKDIVQTAKITRAKETALHVAVSNGKQKVVRELLDIIDPDTIGMMTNERGENPLHLAASLEQVEICKLIVKKDVELIRKRNDEGETPLFLAALHGKKGAFYALHPECPLNDSLYIKHEVMDCRSNDGNTILHVTILGEYFELAIQIINWYPELIMCKNEKGQSALHCLAKNPSAFRSGCHLGPLDDLIYRCFIVDPIKVEMPSDYVDESQLDISIPAPKNYQTCSDLLKIFINAMGKRHKQDIEAPKQEKDGEPHKKCMRSHIKIEATDDADREASRLSTSRPPCPPNYNTFFNFLQFALELFLFILGLGFLEVRKIKDKKRKHILTLTIMSHLIDKSEEWENVESGSKPTTIEPEYESTVNLEQPPQTDQSQPLQTDQSPQYEESKSQGPMLMESINERESQEKDTKEKMIEKIISEMKEKKLQLDVEKTQPNIYNLQMLLMDSQEDDKKKSSPFLIAAKMGVKEMVEEILKVFPVAIWDEDEDKKNVVLLAVENRHPKIYNFLLTKFPHTDKESVYKKVDKEGNSALHLAATLGKNQPWRIPGAALQMQWELKWYKFIKSSMPRHFFARRNEERKTSREVFAETHADMMKEGGTWLTNTSQSCSVVAALIATVAYASATTVPGGVKESTGLPNLRGHTAFNIFTITSLVALCLSVTSLTMFLSILTSRYQVFDFLHNLPTKLILGLTALFLSIAAMLVSFCAGHFFDLEDRMRHTAFPIYVITCLPITIYAVAQFPLYLDILKSTIVSVPERSYDFISI